MKPLLFILTFILLASFAYASLNSGLIHYYTMDNDSISGNTLQDDVGTYDGTILGNVVTGKGGIIGQGFNFTANPANITLGDLDLTNFTMQAWVYGKPSGNGWIVTKYDGASSSYLLASIGGTPRLSIYNPGGGVDLDATNDIVANQWNHIVAMYNTSGDALIYVNNVLSGTNGAMGVMQNSAVDATIGSGSVLGPYLNLVDEVSFWNRSLSPYEVDSLYNSGNGLRPASTAATPEIDSIRISPTIPIPSEDLSGYATGKYINSSFNVSYQWGWYVNTVLNKTNGNLTENETTINYTSGTEVLLDTFDNADISIGDNITFAARAYNGSVFSDWSNTTVTVYRAVIDNCSNIYDIPTNKTAFNITTKSEITGAVLSTNAGFEISYFNLFYATSSASDTYTFCQYPEDADVIGSIYAVMEAGGYNPITFNRFDILFSSQNFSAYLLPESIDVEEITYKVIDVNNDPIESAIFRVYRIISEEETLVFEGQTDITGQVRMYQDTTYQYDYKILASGFPEKNFSLQPTAKTTKPDYTIKISSEDTSYFNNPYVGIRYRHEPEDILFNNSGEWINLSFILQGNNLEEVGMNFYDHDYECVPSNCTDTISAIDGGKVTVSIKMNRTGTLTGAYWFRPIGGKNIYVNDNKIKVVEFVSKLGKSLVDLVAEIKENTSPNMRTVFAVVFGVVFIGIGSSLGLFGAALILPTLIANIILSLPAIGLINPYVGSILSIFGAIMFLLFSMGRSA